MKELEELEEEYCITEVGIEALDGNLEDRLTQAILLVLYEAYLDDINGEGILDTKDLREIIDVKKYLVMSKEDFIAEVQRVAQRGKQ